MGVSVNCNIWVQLAYLQLRHTVLYVYAVWFVIMFILYPAVNMSNPDDDADSINPSSPVCAVEMESLNDVKCEDVDLLSVSCKLAHFSIDVVGQCLGLQESQIQNAFKRVTDRHHDHNKAHLLLIKWREVKGEATWGALYQLLQNLPDIADNIQGEFILPKQDNALFPVLTFIRITGESPAD